MCARHHSGDHRSWGRLSVGECVSGVCRPAASIFPLTGSLQQRPDSLRGQGRLAHEADGRARLDQLEELLLRVGGDKDELPGFGGRVVDQLPCHVETALPAEVDVEQCHVRPQFGRPLDGFSPSGGHADYLNALLLEKRPRCLEEARVVVDDQAAQGHRPRVIDRLRAAIPASYHRSAAAHAGQPTMLAPIIIAVVATRAQVVVADDDVLLREGLTSLLTESGFEVVGRAGNPTELLALVRDRRPDLVIVDIRMPPTHTTEGLDAARVIRQELPDTAILVLSAHVEVEQATELLASGQRCGYLLKSRISDIDDFLGTLDRIVKGAAVVDPALVQELLAVRRVNDPLQVLSSREREVLALMAEGRSNNGIAHQIFVTEGTVEKHVRSILMKLQIPEASDDHRRVLAVLTFLDHH